MTATCRKVRYPSRTAARHAPPRRLDRGLRPYFCEPCLSWHLGHLPGRIRAGLRSRAEVYPTGDAA